MNTKLINTRSAVIGLALLMLNASPVLAGSITLSGATGNSCSYSTFSVDSSGNLTATCIVSSSPTLTPTCTLVASPSTINAGSISTLTASCSPAATSYAWTGAGTTNFTAGGSVTPTATTTYTVTGTNGGGAGNTASAIVSIQVIAPPSTPSPQSGSTLTMAEWVASFMELNNIPPARWTLLGAYAYCKTLYQAKPFAYQLPPGGLLVGY